MGTKTSPRVQKLGNKGGRVPQFSARRTLASCVEGRRGLSYVRQSVKKGGPSYRDLSLKLEFKTEPEL